MTERVEMRGTPSSSVSVAAWQARADELRKLMLDAGQDPAAVADDLRTAFSEITFVDTTGALWRHDGQRWWCWRAEAWAASTPPPELYLESVVFELPPEAAPADQSPAVTPTPPGTPTRAVTPASANAPAPAVAPPTVIASGALAPAVAAPPVPTDTGPAPQVPAAYHATHRVPAAGMNAWNTPDPASPAAARLDPWLDVQLLQQLGNGWAQIRCSNGWEAWVDGRMLAPG